MLKLFHADLFVEKNVGTPEQQKKIKDLLISIPKNDKFKNIPLTNQGCIRFDFNLLKNSVDWLTEAKVKLTEKAISHYSPIDVMFNERLQQHSKPYLKTHFKSWVNINEPGSKNVVHSHKPHMFASVYYLNGTGTGKVWFHNESNLLNDCSVRAPFVRKFVYEPEDGDLILWPAWVPHEGDVNTSNRQRINITSNIYMK